MAGLAGAALGAVTAPARSAAALAGAAGGVFGLGGEETAGAVRAAYEGVGALRTAAGNFASAFTDYSSRIAEFRRLHPTEKVDDSTLESLFRAINSNARRNDAATSAQRAFERAEAGHTIAKEVLNATEEAARQVRLRPSAAAGAAAGAAGSPPPSPSSRSDTYNRYGNPYEDLPEERQRFFDAGRIRARRMADAPELAAAAIELMTPDDANYGMYEGQFFIGRDDFTRVRAMPRPVLAVAAALNPFATRKVGRRKDAMSTRKISAARQGVIRILANKTQLYRDSRAADTIIEVNQRRISFVETQIAATIEILHSVIGTYPAEKQERHQTRVREMQKATLEKTTNHLGRLAQQNNELMGEVSHALEQLRTAAAATGRSVNFRAGAAGAAAGAAGAAAVELMQNTAANVAALSSNDEAAAGGAGTAPAGALASLHAGATRLASMAYSAVARVARTGAAAATAVIDPSVINAIFKKLEKLYDLHYRLIMENAEAAHIKAYSAVLANLYEQNLEFERSAEAITGVIYPFEDRTVAFESALTRSIGVTNSRFAEAMRDMEAAAAAAPAAAAAAGAAAAAAPAAAAAAAAAPLNEAEATAVPMGNFLAGASSVSDRPAPRRSMSISLGSLFRSPQSAKGAADPRGGAGNGAAGSRMRRSTRRAGGARRRKSRKQIRRR